MITEEIKELIKEYITNEINDYDYSNLDTFIEEHELNDQEITELIEYVQSLIVIEKDYY